MYKSNDSLTISGSIGGGLIHTWTVRLTDWPTGNTVYKRVGWSLFRKRADRAYAKAMAEAERVWGL